MQSRSCGVSPQQMNAQRAFKTVSEQGWGRLVPVKRRVTDKTRGGGRPRAILELLLMNARRTDSAVDQPRWPAQHPSTEHGRCRANIQVEPQGRPAGR